MRAVMFHGPGKPITLESIPDPVPGPGEMVLKVGRCGICGSDIHLTEEDGYYEVGAPLGHEFSGEVVALGKGVEGFAIGDIVTSLPFAGCGHCRACLEGQPFLCPQGGNSCSGAFADFVRVKASVSMKLPAALSLADGAMVEPLAVGLHGASLAGIKPGAKVLVTGAGAVGLSAAFFARRLGAGRIVMAARSRRGEAMARAMGADDFVITGKDEVGEVQERLGGAPDVVFETIGVAGGLGQAINHIRPDGMVVSLGFCTRPDAILPAFATWKQTRMLFSMGYSLGEFRHTIDTLDRGHIEPRVMLGDPIPLEAVPGMIERMRTEKPPEAKVQCDPGL